MDPRSLAATSVEVSAAMNSLSGYSSAVYGVWFCIVMSSMYLLRESGCFSSSSTLAYACSSDVYFELLVDSRCVICGLLLSAWKCEKPNFV